MIWLVRLIGINWRIFWSDLRCLFRWMSSPLNLSITPPVYYPHCTGPDLCGECPHCQARRWLSLTRDWLRDSQRRAQLEFSCWLASKLPHYVITRLLSILPNSSPKEGLAPLFTFTRASPSPVRRSRGRKLRPGKQEADPSPLAERVRGWLERAPAPVQLHYAMCILRELGGEQVLAFVRTAREAGRRQDGTGESHRSPSHPLTLHSQTPPTRSHGPHSPTRIPPTRSRTEPDLRVREDEIIFHPPESGTFSLFQTAAPSLDEDPIPSPLSRPTHDLIRHLPVHLSKWILHQLPVSTLCCCLLVSRHWHQLSSEVLRERKLRDRMELSAVAVQGASSRICNPRYASMVSVEGTKGPLSPSASALDKSPSLLMRRLRLTRFGRSERLGGDSVSREERNVFCGAYNVTGFQLPLGLLGSVCSYDMGKVLAVAGKEGKVHLIDTRGKLISTFSAHVAVVKSVMLARVPSGSHIDHVLATGSYDLTVRLWSLKTGRYTRIFIGHTKSVLCLDLKDGQLLSGSHDKTARLWDVFTGRCLHVFQHAAAVACVRVTHEKYVTGSEDGLVFTWDHRTCRLLRRLEEHSGAITFLALDSLFLMSAGQDGGVKQWLANSPSCRSVRTYTHPAPVSCLHFLYLRLVTGGEDGKIRIWSMVDGSCIKVIMGNSTLEPIHSLYVHSNRILVCSVRNVTLFHFEEEEWDYQTEFAGQGYVMELKPTV